MFLIIGTVFLLVGSILAYIFAVKIFICIGNRHTYLMPGFVALIAGVLLYGGTKQWEPGAWCWAGFGWHFAVWLFSTHFII